LNKVLVKLGDGYTYFSSPTLVIREGEELSVEPTSEVSRLLERGVLAKVEKESKKEVKKNG